MRSLAVVLGQPGPRSELLAENNDGPAYAALRGAVVYVRTQLTIE
jgi:hypothetical protein